MTEGVGEPEAVRSAALNLTRWPLSKLDTQRLPAESKSGKEGSLKIQQDVEVSALSLDKGKEIEKKIPQNRYGWLHVIDGEIKMNGDVLRTGDAAAIDPNTDLKIIALTQARVLFFDLK